MSGDEVFPFIVAIVGIGVGGTVTMIKIGTKHRLQVLEMQLRLRNEGSTQTQPTLVAMREEVQSLRDTTMQYDLSFDTALQRMENRMEALERKVQQMESTENSTVHVGR